MRKLRAYFARFGELFHRQWRDQELAAELDSHLQMHIEDNLRAGLSPIEARRQALIKFGGLESTVETYRERRGFSFGGTVLQDLRYALRQLRKSPGFTAAVVLSLALGIGANTAIFSLIDAVMLKFLRVQNPEQLVLLKWVWRGQGMPPMIHNLSGDSHFAKGRFECSSFSYPAFQSFQANRNVFSDLFAFTDTAKMNLGADGRAEIVEGELASGNYFSGLGVGTEIGRLFTLWDDRPEAQPTAVISYRYWERRFGKDRSVVGKTITINGVPFTVIGVTAPEFFGLHPGTALDVWMPLSSQPQVEPGWVRQGRSKFLRGDDWWLIVMGRLRPGVSEPRALAQLAVTFRQAADARDSTVGESPDLSKGIPHQGEFPTLEFSPGGKGLGSLRDEFSRPLLVLMTVVGFVLLIACANVANLLLARATSRHREVAVRLAVGADRKRLIRQLLTESVLLALLGGVFGLLLAYLATRVLITLMSSGGELIALTVRPDLHVLGFTAAVSLGTGVLFGLVPALKATQPDLATVLKENSKGQASPERSAGIGLGKVLVVSQVAMTLVLLMGAGLFVRTLGKLDLVNVGFNQRNLLLFGVDPTQNGYKDEKLAEFYQELQRRIETLPGVHSASFSVHSLIGGGVGIDGISIPGYTPSAREVQSGSVEVYYNEVGPHFFKTMAAPLLLGRAIDVKDTDTNPKIAIINQTLARKYFANSDPIGRHFLGFGDGEKNNANIEIVGVVGDTKYSDLRQDVPPTIFLPIFQNLKWMDREGTLTFEVRTVGDPHELIPAVRHAVRSTDPNVPLSNVRTQVEQIDQTLFQERLFAKLSSFFGLLALALACIGLYGIMSYAVARRTHEIGIRMALGARQEDILLKVLREAFLLALVGVAIGIPIALGALRLISSMLFGLKPTDPLTLAAAIAFMLAVSALAGYLPARRASRVNPMVALRYE